MRKTLYVMVALVAIACLLFGCASPNASIKVAIQQIEAQNDNTIADYQMAIAVMQADYIKNGKRILAREMETLLVSGDSLPAQKVAEAFFRYQANLEAFQGRVNAFNAELGKINAKREITKKLLAAIYYYHDGKDLQNIVIEAVGGISTALLESQDCPFAGAVGDAITGTGTTTTTDCTTGTCGDSTCSTCGGSTSCTTGTCRKTTCPTCNKNRR